MLYVVVFTFSFLLPLIFTLMAASIFHFLTAAIKFLCHFSTEIGLLCCFISGSSSFPDIHASVDFKIKWKERIGFVVVVFKLSLKVLVAIILGDPGAVSRVGTKGGTKVFKYGQKSPWVPTLTELFPKIQADAGS